MRPPSEFRCDGSNVLVHRASVEELFICPVCPHTSPGPYKAQLIANMPAHCREGENIHGRLKAKRLRRGKYYTIEKAFRQTIPGNRKWHALEGRPRFPNLATAIMHVSEMPQTFDYRIMFDTKIVWPYQKKEVQKNEVLSVQDADFR